MTNAPPGKTSPNVIFRLSVMMFIQFFVWGSWYVSMTGFINTSGMSDVTGAAYMVGPIAAILSPFFLGLVADRYFSSEQVLGVLHVVGGLLLIAAPYVATPFSLQPEPPDAGLFHTVVLHDLPAFGQPFILLLLLHMLCYMPTIALTVSLSFHNLANQEREFPGVRVLGTIGWIVGNIAVGLLPGQDESASQFFLAGGSGILLGLYCFTLPHTPPPAAGTRPTIGQVLGLDSLALFKIPAYAVFMICSFLICIPLAGYYQQARNFVASTDTVVTSMVGGLAHLQGASFMSSPTFTMSFGQMSEIFFMLIMPFCFARLGVKWMLAVGMGAWVARYGLFALGADDNLRALVFLGVLLHGVCYDFFFVTGMIYVDKKANDQIRSQAQGFLVLITQGLGMLIGAKVFFSLVLHETDASGAVNWYNVWLYPCLFALAILVIFVLFFWDKTNSDGAVSEADVAQAAAGDEQP